MIATVTIGNVCLELAMMEYDSNNFEKSKDYVLKARKNLLMSMHHDFPFAYVLMARLSDFVKDEIREEDLESLDDIEKVIFRTISRRSWRWVIPEVFKLEEKGKVQFERYDKGTSRISLLVDENFPIRYSFIVKSFHDEAEAKLDFLVTRSINQALKPEIKFTRPLALRYHKTEDGYNYHLVLERVPSRSLDDIFTVMDRDEKLASLNHAVDSLNFFHKSTTRKFSEKGYILEDQVNNETVKHKIEDISYLENFIERVLVGRNKKVIKETIGKLNSGETNDLKCDPKRLGFNEHFLDFYEAHKHFIDFHLSNESFNVVLHGDFYVGNVLDDYTIIDPKELRKGNMMFDLSYFLENVAYHVKDEGLSEDEVIGAVASSLEIVFGENVDLKEVKKQYLCFALHNSVCHASSFCKLGEIDEADFHYNKAIGLMDKLGLTDLKEKYRAYVRETKFNEERVYLRVKNYINKCVQNSDPRNFVEHSCDVEKWVQRMDCNVSVKVKIAALMHDVERAFAVDRKRDVGRSYSDYKEEHAERSTQIVENFLGDLNIKPKFLEDILCLVRCHEVGLSEDHLLYKEMCVLKDADAISFFEESNFDKYLEIWGKEVAVKKIDYSFQRLTERGKSLAKPLYESACKKVA